MTTPPGWYPDQSGTQRWFDGYRWTGAVSVPLPPKRQLPLWIPISVMVLGLALIGWSSTMGLPHPLSIFKGPHLSAPGRATVQLDAGPWTVYEQDGTVGQSGPVSYSDLHPATILPSDITVDGTAGRVVGESHESMTLNDRHYVGVARFSVGTGGRHEISVASRDQGPRDVVITRPISYAFRGWRGLVLGIGGGLVTTVGVVLLMLSLARRRSAAKD